MKYLFHSFRRTTEVAEIEVEAENLDEAYELADDVLLAGEANWTVVDIEEIPEVELIDEY